MTEYRIYDRKNPEDSGAAGDAQQIREAYHQVVLLSPTIGREATDFMIQKREVGDWEEVSA